MALPRTLSLVQRGLLIIAIPVVYQIVLLGVLIQRQGEAEEALRWAVHTKEVLLQADAITMAHLELQGSLRAYVIAPNERFRRELDTYAAPIPGMLDELGRTVADNPPQVARVARLREAVLARLRYTEEFRALVDRGEQARIAEETITLRGAKLSDAIGAEMNAFRVEENKLDRERTDALRLSGKSENWLLGSGLVLAILAGIGTAAYFARSIGRRLEGLRENVRRIAAGETLHGRQPGHDEIAELDHAFHDMAENLAEARAAEEASQATLARRNDELLRSNRDLDHKSQENEMFVYSVSHDIRSPLVNLQGFSKELGLVRGELLELLGSELPAPARARARTLVERDVGESIHFIQTAVSRLSAIIDALLRLSRAGRVEYRPESVELQGVVERIVDAMRATIVERGAEVTVAGPLPTVWGDPTAVEQVFANLVGNAVNYLDPKRPGRVEVARCEPPPARAAGMEVFVVRDNGLGIPEAHLPKVFAIFQRLHAAVAPGEGIGLALVRRMVERHGGSIWVESQAGVGSSFYVALPPRESSPLLVAPRKETVRPSAPAEP